MLTKILLFIFLGYVYSFHDTSVQNQAVNFNSTHYSIQYDLTSGFFNVLYNNVLVISNAYSLVYNGNMALNSTAYASHTLTQINFNDNFGSGICYTVTSNSDTMPPMQQNYYVYSGRLVKKALWRLLIQHHHHDKHFSYYKFRQTPTSEFVEISILNFNTY